MNKLFMLLFGAAALPASIFAEEINDSSLATKDIKRNLKELVVVSKRSAVRQAPDRIIYTVKNDQYAVGLNGMELLDRIPRISVINDQVNVAGKSGVKYIVDGHLLEMTEEAIKMKLKNLQANGIKKIELLTTPPAKYAAGDNIAFISITTRNESLGTRGNVWGNARQSDYFNYSLGGNISHTTRKIELSGDISRNDSKGKNDTYKEYIFQDYSRISDRRNEFTWQTLGINGLFKYKFNNRWSAGVIVNYSNNRTKNNIIDKTIDRGESLLSQTIVPFYPENAVTLTGFADWAIDDKGKMLSLTYNRFDKRLSSFSDISTQWEDSKITRITKDDSNRYGIHSVKLDATLPFHSFKIETGGAYTAIRNKTGLTISNDIAGSLVVDPAQSNHFRYDEKTAALYISAEKNITNSLFGKIGLRYEHTDVAVLQEADNSRNRNGHDYLFPTVLLSWSIPDGGRLAADYSMGISRPSFGDLNPFRYYTTVNDYFTGNPKLKSMIVHNVGINYSYKGFYAVLYSSWNRDAIGYITYFSPDGMQWTIPENCFNKLKTGIYASYSRSLFNRWNINVGGEVFYSETDSDNPYYKDDKESGWSGKLELNTSLMLTRKKNLIFNLRCTHYFPYQDGMIKYENRTFLNCELRYMLLDNRLTMTAAVTDPFGWSSTNSTATFNDYTLNSKNNVHQHAVALRISYSFGGKKVNNVYRDSKERESQRAN